MSASAPLQTDVPHPARQAWRHRLAQKTGPRGLMQTLNAALMLYLLTTVLTLSIATLVYAGPLAQHLPDAVGGVLIGTALMMAVVSGLGRGAARFQRCRTPPG